MNSIKPDDLNLLPLYYGFKFGPKNRLEDIRKGKIYMKHLDYFINLESENCVRGKGDKHDAEMVSSNNVRGIDLITGKLLFTCAAQMREKGIKNFPVFCMTVKNIFENIITFEDPKITSKLTFDKKLLDDFYVPNQDLFMLVITDINEFNNRINDELIKLGIKLSRNFITYRNTNGIYKTGNFFEYNGPFIKNPCFSHQEEYRLLAQKEVDDHLILNIGSLKNITAIVKVKDIILNGIRIEASIS